MLPSDLAPALFPKFDDGRWHPLCVVLGAPYLAPFQIWHYACKRRRKFRHCEVIRGLYLGRPILFRLLPADTAVVVDLAMELQADYNVIRHLDYLSLPTIEDSVPLAEPLCSALAYAAAALEDGRAVYVHCGEASMTRSGLFITGLLVLHALKGLSPRASPNDVLDLFQQRLKGEPASCLPGPDIFQDGPTKLSPLYAALCQPPTVLFQTAKQADVPTETVSTVLLALISELVTAAEAHVVACQAEADSVGPRGRGLLPHQREFLYGALWEVLLQPDNVVRLLPAGLRGGSTGLSLLGTVCLGYCLGVLFGMLLVHTKMRHGAYHVTGCLTLILYAAPIINALGMEYERYKYFRTDSTGGAAGPEKVEHPMVHPARRCFFFGLVCDAVFALSLAMGRTENVLEGRQCQVRGLLAQLGITGSIAWFCVLCVHMALQVWDPFKQGLGKERWFPFAWAVLSLTVFFVGPSTYGPSQVGFCWIAHRPAGLFSSQSLSLTYIPTLLTVMAALLAVRWSRHNKTNFPNWHRDNEAFRLSRSSLIIFSAAWGPFLLCRFMWTLSPVFFPEYLSVEGSLQLRVNLSAIIFGQAIMKALFWVEMMRTSMLPTPGTALNSLHLQHLLIQGPDNVQRLWHLLLGADHAPNLRRRLPAKAVAAVQAEIAAVVAGGDVARAAGRIEELLQNRVTLEHLLGTVRPGEQEEALIPKRFRQEVANFITATVQAELEETIAEAAKQSFRSGSPAPTAEPDAIVQQLWGMPSVRAVADELTRVFQRAFWYRFLVLLHEDLAYDPMFPLVRLVLWNQLVVIWHTRRPPLSPSGRPGYGTLFEDFVQEFTRPQGEGYLGSMRRDYITAVEHALFHISLRMPRACGIDAAPVAQGSFQAVPGFPQASYTDYAPEIFSEIQALYHVNPRDYRRSLCRLQAIGHAGGSGVRMLMTHDRLFVVKQVTHSERNELLRILRRYYKHLQGSATAGGPPASLIVPIFGCHAVRMASRGASRTILLVVMANVDAFGQGRSGGPLCPAVVKVDLKGSWVHREVRPTEFLQDALRDRAEWPGGPACFGKDVDVLRTCARLSEAEWASSFALPPAKAQQLRSDAAFLAAEGLMDYSLLAVVFTEAPTAFAIVDYLQRWDRFKRWERLAKRCNCGVSAAPAGYYANRFTRNLTRLLCYRRSFCTNAQSGASLSDTTSVVEDDRAPLLQEVQELAAP
eukprot:EG_transcript_605